MVNKRLSVIKLLAVIMILCQFGIGALFLWAGAWKEGLLGFLLGIANAIIFLF